MNGGNFLIILLIALAVIIVGFFTYTAYTKSQLNNNTMYVIIGIIAAAVTGFIIYLMYKNEKPKPGSQKVAQASTTAENIDSSFVKINATLDSEHQGIMNALDNAYNLSKSHGDTEKKMFMNGQAKLCSGHSDVTGMWTEHDQDHSRLLDMLVQLKKDFIAHIENYDKPHFHWVND